MNELLFSSDDEDGDRIPKVREYRPRLNFDIEDPFCFKEKFCLKKDAFEIVLTKVGRYLKHRTDKNHALTPDQQLLVTLHWLGNGCQYHGIADMHGIVKATVCRAVWDVVHVIVDHMFQEVVRWPEDCSNIALDFLQHGGFPFVCGCADGNLFPIDAPYQHESHFVDRKGNHSLNTLMICGPDTTFYYVNPQWPGATHDSRVMRNSDVCQRFDNGWRPFKDAVVLGDSAYGLSEWLIPPLFNNPNNPAEMEFNRSHKSTRRIIECAYGVLTERFPCLNYLRLQPEKAALVIIVCATLHNIASKDDFEYTPTPREGNLDVQHEIEPNKNVMVDKLLNYFT